MISPVNNGVASATQELLAKSSSQANVGETGKEETTVWKWSRDSVEISDEARQLYLDSLEGGKVFDLKQEAREKIGEEKIEEFRSMMSSVASKKRGLTAKLKKALEGIGLSGADLKKIKVEVNSKGEVAVGGIDDVELTNKIEKIVNADKGLVAEIKAYQKQESELSAKLQQETGMNLGDVYRRLLAEESQAAKQAEADASGLDPDSDEYRKRYGSMDQIPGISLEGVDLFIADDELLELAKEIGSFDGVNFSSERRGVADPKGALEGVLNNAVSLIQSRFADFNKKAKDSAPTTEIGLERQVSLNGVEISVTADGKIKIEGEFSASGDSNAEAEKIVREVLQQMMTADEEFGQESIFHTAARQMLADHNEEYTEHSEFGKQVTLRIKNGVGNAYVASEEAQSTIMGEIKEKALQHLESELGQPLDENSIEVTEDGLIRFTGSFSGELANRARAAIDLLNSRINENVYDEKDETERKESIDQYQKADAFSLEIARLVKELNEYRPDSRMKTGGE